MTYFNAPWGPTVWLGTVVAGALMLVVAAQTWRESGIVVGSLLPLVILGLCALFTVRGYTVTRDDILVHRLLWKTRISRRGLQSATHEPQAASQSWRTLGNRGVLGITGWFRNSTLGLYRAYMTDFQRAVVLRYKRSTILVSPDDPVRFIREVTGATVTLDWAAEQERAAADAREALLRPRGK